VLAVTLLLLGVPIWAFYWADVQRYATQQPEERTALPRRVYLFAIFGAASVVLLVNLTIVLFNFFDALLGEGLTSEVLRDSRWSIALVLTAGVAAAYHWAVLAEDRPAYALVREPRRRPTRDVILLVADGAEDLIEGLADLPDVRVRVWHRMPPTEGVRTVPSGRIDTLRAELDASPANSLVIVDEDGEMQVEWFEADSGRADR
jgi:hypothetical protein